MSDKSKSSKKKPKMWTLHCTDTSDELDFTAKNIRHWHMTENGWTDIGYHYVICKDGTIEKGRPDYKQGAHVRKHNRQNLGVVWVGRYHLNEAQQYALLYLYNYLRIKYGIHTDSIFGHHEFDTANGKTCPNLEMDDLRDWFEHSTAITLNYKK